MPVYAFAPQRDNKPTSGESAVNLGNQLGELYGKYKQGKATEAADAVLANPESTPMQQALAWATKGQNQAVAQTLKQGGIQKVQQDIANRFPELSGGMGNGGAQNIPGATPPIMPKTVTGTTRQPPNAQIPDEVVNANEEPTSQTQPENTVSKPLPGTQLPNRPGLSSAEQKLQHAAQLRKRGEAFNAAGLTSNANADQSAATSLENQAAGEIKQDRQEAFKVRERNQKEIQDFSKSYTDIQALQKNVKDLEEAEKLIKSGKVSLDTNFTKNIIQAVAEGKEQYAHLADFLKTPEQQRLFSLLRTALKTKDIGGSNPSTKEVLIAMSALPNQYKGTEANLAIIRNMLQDAKINLEKGKTINTLRKDQNLSFPDFQEQLNAKLQPLQDEFANQIQMETKIATAKQTLKGQKPPPGHVSMMMESGEPRFVRVEQVPAALEQKGILLND